LPLRIEQLGDDVVAEVRAPPAHAGAATVATSVATARGVKRMDHPHPDNRE